MTNHDTTYLLEVLSRIEALAADARMEVFGYAPFADPCQAPDHCPHNTGQAQPSLPPRFELLCCYCGQTAWVGAGNPTTEHGPYRPSHDRT